MSALKKVTLVAVDNPDLKMDIKIPLGGYSANTGRIDYSGLVYQNYIDEVINELFGVFGDAVAFRTEFFESRNTLAPDYDQTYIHYWNAVNKLTAYADLYCYGDMVNSAFTDEPGLLSSSQTWYLEGSDPDTRWYVNFSPTGSPGHNLRVRVYNHSMVQQAQYDDSHTHIQNKDVDIHGIQDWSAFIESPSAAASDSKATRVLVSQGTVSYTTGDDQVRYYKSPYIYYGYGSSPYYRWLWYLINNGGGDAEDYTPSYPSDDPYTNNGYNESEPGGGDGDGNPYDEGDDIDYPADPPVSICDTNMITLYTPDLTTVNQLGADIWSSNFINSMVHSIYANPMDVIVSLGIVPFNVTPAGSKHIMVGERDTGIASAYPASNYVNFDMGEVALKKAIGAYTDYAPYTKGQIYIPYVGYVPLDIDAFMGHKVGLKYKCDLCTGSAIAFLLRDGKVRQQFACNLLTKIPLSAANYEQMWGSLLSAMGTLAGAGLAGAGAASGAAQAAEAAQGGNAAMQAGKAAASDILTGITTKPTFQFSNNLGGTGGLLGNKKAFILLERPNLALPNQQNKYTGYPTYMTVSLASARGYTRVASVLLGLPGATDQEKTRILEYLKSGVIIGSPAASPSGDVVLMQNSAPDNKIGKNAAVVASLTGTFRDECDMLNPVVRIERSTATGFNYVYVSAFGRYYHVRSVNIVRHGIIDLILDVDPLESFASAILGHNAIIDKQESLHNLYLNDDSLKMYHNPLLSAWEFPNAFWAGSEYVLITAGG